MSACIFCRIAQGDIPAMTVYEDDRFLAFLDITPLNKGHVLVVPKEHYRWVWDYPAVGKYFEVVTRVVKAQKKVFGTDFVVSCVIGEEVPHAHVHVVPRFPDDGHGGSIDFSNKKQLAEEEMRHVQNQLRAALHTI